MALDDNERTQVHKIEHSVRHILGLYEGLARHLLNVVPDDEAELRAFVAMHAARAGERGAEVTTMLRRLLDGPAAPTESKEANRGTGAPHCGG